MSRTRRPSHIAIGVVALTAAAAVAVGGTEAVRNASSSTTAFTPSSQGSSTTWGYQGNGDGNGWGGYSQGNGSGDGNGWGGYSQGNGKGNGSGDGNGWGGYSQGNGSSGNGSSGDGSSGNGFGSNADPFGNPGGGSSGDGSGSTGVQAAGQATAAQVAGVVDIVTTLDYGTGEAAGTGMVLTSDGRILTNNHVVDGSTSIKVTVLSTGRTYTAKVVGTSPTNDVAVIQLADASGLKTASLGNSSSVSVGDAVTGVGNAGNAPGTSAAEGTVTALDQSITASDEGGGPDSENLTGLIQTNADIQAGDSGGPLYDAHGAIVGIDTAAQTDQSGATTAGYAIPINHALDVARQIVSGVDNSTIHQGLPAFLGIRMSTQGASPAIAGVVDGSAAASAGISAGSTITAIGGTAVSSSSDISAAIATHHAGDRVTIHWTDANGAGHSATVRLGQGPAD